MGHRQDGSAGLTRLATGLLCNGVIVFDDMGEILPGGRLIPPRGPACVRLPVAT